MQTVVLLFIGPSRRIQMKIQPLATSSYAESINIYNLHLILPKGPRTYQLQFALFGMCMKNDNRVVLFALNSLRLRPLTLLTVRTTVNNDGAKKYNNSPFVVLIWIGKSRPCVRIPNLFNISKLFNCDNHLITCGRKTINAIE